MTPQQWQRAKKVLETVLDEEPGRRVGLLTEICADDSALRADVEALLLAYEQAGSFLELSAIDLASNAFAPALPAGTRLGVYEIRALIGVGGMGEVYRAYDTRLGRNVAIKILHRAFTGDTNRLERFEREARLLATLNHPHICTLYDVGPNYLVMELCDGETLAARLKRGRLSLEETIMNGIQIADALTAAHSKRIIHRDLKPGNIMLTENGVKVLDFGLAMYEGSQFGVSLVDLSNAPALGPTASGVLLGTAAYMSPEQARGKIVDKRTDIWAFGCVLYEMLTGRTAFASDSVAGTIAAIIEREPEWDAVPGSTPSNVRALVRDCLQKDPTRRLRDIADVRLKNQVEPDGRQPSIAVLPFANLSPDKDNEYFSDGLAEEIINILAHISGLKVIARTSAFAFKAKQEDVRRIAEVLGVTNILEGSVRKSGQRIRVTVQLIAANDGSHLWSERYDRELADVFAIQDEIAQAIAAALEVKLAEKPIAAQRHILAVPAYEAYLKARYHWARMTPEALARSKDYLQQALALEPGFALAHSELAHYFFTMYSAGLLPAHEAAPLVWTHANKALEIEPTLPEAHAWLGILAAMYDYDWTDADRRFRLAFAHLPVPPIVRRVRAFFFLAHVGRVREAVADEERLLEEDPLNVTTRWTLATCLRSAGRDEEADARYQQVVELEHGLWSTYAADVLSGDYAARGAIPEALALAETAYSRSPWYPLAIGQLAGLLARTGNEKRSAMLMEKLRPGQAYGAPVGMAAYYLASEDIERAVDWFEKAIEQRDIWVPFFLTVGVCGGGAFRSSPRWPTLARMINLPRSVAKSS
jgi:serine/threonine-protein kinase